MTTSPIYPWFNEFYIGKLTYAGYLLFSRLQHTHKDLELTRIVGLNSRLGKYYWSYPAGFSASEYHGYQTVRVCFKSSRYFKPTEFSFDTVIVLAHDDFERYEIQYQVIPLDVPIKLVEMEGKKKILNYTYKRFEVLTGNVGLKFNLDYPAESFMSNPLPSIDYYTFNRWYIESELRRVEVTNNTDT